MWSEVLRASPRLVQHQLSGCHGEPGGYQPGICEGVQGSSQSPHLPPALLTHDSVPTTSQTGPDGCPNPGPRRPMLEPLPTGRRPQHTGHTRAACLLPGARAVPSRILKTTLPSWGARSRNPLREQRVSGPGHSPGPYTPWPHTRAHTQAPSGHPSTPLAHVGVGPQLVARCSHTTRAYGARAVAEPRDFRVQRQLVHLSLSPGSFNIYTCENQLVPWVPCLHLPNPVWLPIPLLYRS